MGSRGEGEREQGGGPLRSPLSQGARVQSSADRAVSSSAVRVLVVAWTQGKLGGGGGEALTMHPGEGGGRFVP